MKKGIERELKEILSLSSAIDEILTDLAKEKADVNTLVVMWQTEDGRRYSNYLGDENVANFLLDLTKNYLVSDRELPGGEQ